MLAPTQSESLHGGATGVDVVRAETLSVADDAVVGRRETTGTAE